MLFGKIALGNQTTIMYKSCCLFGKIACGNQKTIMKHFLFGGISCYQTTGERESHCLFGGIACSNQTTIKSQSCILIVGLAYSILATHLIECLSYVNHTDELKI